MITEKQDAQVEVKVPAQNGRKAYSYFRNASAIKKGAAGAGAALALGGLAAAAIALRKKPEESNALPASVETPDPVIVPPSTASRVGEFAKKAAIGTGKTAATLAGSIAVNKAVSFAVKKVASKIAEKPEESSEARRARYAAEDLAAEEAYEQRKAAKDRERQAANIPDRLPSPKPKVEVGGAMVLVGKAAETPKGTEKPKPPRFREQAEFAEGDEPRTPILVNGKANPEYLKAVTQSSFNKESGEAGRLARNISAERAGVKLSPENKRLPGYLTNEEIMAVSNKQPGLRDQLYRGEYLPPPDLLPSPNGVLPSARPKFEIPRTLIPPVRSQSSPSSALTIAPSESPRSTGNTIAKPQKTLLTKVSGSAGAALGRLVRKGKEGWERDRQAGGISSLPDKEYDVNRLANKAGKGTRSVAESVANFAQSFYSTFVDKDNAIDVKAEEVKEPATQKRIRGVTIRALPQGGKRGRGRPKTKFGPKDFIKPEDKQVRNNSIYMRIDTFIGQLREDAKCGSGNKSCGKICIPQEKSCLGETAKAFGGGALQALAGPIGSGTYRALRKRGHGRGMSVGGAIAANVATTAGMVGLGAMAAKKAEDEELKRGKK